MQNLAIDPKSGFCEATGIYYSKREHLKLPADPSLTLPKFIFHHQRVHPTATAYIDATTGASLSYGQLKSQVFSLAAGMSSFGVQPGDVVFILSPNSIAFAVSLLATMACGAIATTTNPLNTPSEIAKQASDSRAKFFVSPPSLISKLPKLVPLILLKDLDMNDLEHLGLANKSPKKSLELDRQTLASLLAKRGFPRFATFSELLQSKNSLVSLDSCGRQDDTAALLYSSGTTGTSKGVIITHRNFIAQVQTMTHIEGIIPWASSIYMCIIPMFHVYGMACFVCALLAKGSTVVLQQRFDLVETLRTIEKYRITHAPVVPPVLIALAKSPVVQKFDLSSLVAVGSGAAPLGKDVMDAFTKRFPNVYLPQGYGLTESTAVGANSATPEEARQYGSAGLIAPNMEFKIVDVDSRALLPPNQRGEIWMRGPTIMKGYFSNPGETATVLDREGWLHTGDLGYVNEDGFVYIVDRLKELIKYKGFQVAPYKKIRRVTFVPSIPKSASGKILRGELIKIANSRL
ncbi:hypothetical protein KP509_25G005800 [Ceratopteris richardii]|uniref:AMP-dependent synthetase/ligase domain-containing protein n=1 Tax=Ceratopteris richardii TaxID=49495 RepID=A0A8T2RNS2_CERRI|nr:hypothetical protein KP509_25G005800 [Ceratopteris richardii]